MNQNEQMTDCELLQLAAKTAGIKLYVWGSKGKENFADVSDAENHKLWNPLTDDGDALRLAVKLNIAVHPGFAYTPTGKLINYRDNAKRIAATRRAIVRAAAEIGRDLP